MLPMNEKNNNSSPLFYIFNLPPSPRPQNRTKKKKKKGKIKRKKGKKFSLWHNYGAAEIRNISLLQLCCRFDAVFSAKESTLE